MKKVSDSIAAQVMNAGRPITEVEAAIGQLRHEHEALQVGDFYTYESIKEPPCATH